ncbi:NUDIX domain-containing protein [Nonomuraea sp. NBC_01738]|uniref:NUDIX domain-containing protein n=1 Tax=Nonomuraea sp. NBC_01738 TaxID=2976003 RepID=UPI002E0E3BA6|nr:NUDIX domain-containing protein [Nonomuraea sp. NBC_01738]
MGSRVRAVLVTPRGRLLTIKRVRAGAEPYWVLPGGGVEASDASLEAALRREVLEEVGGHAVIGRLLRVVRGEHFFLARIDTWDPVRRSGPEFADPANGAYLLEEIPAEMLGRVNLQPESIVELVVAELLGLEPGRAPAAARRPVE